MCSTSFNYQKNTSSIYRVYTSQAEISLTCICLSPAILLSYRAPCRRMIHPFRRKERVEPIPLGRVTNLAGNLKGTRACHERTNGEEDAYAPRRARPARYGQAGFAEPKFPTVQ